MDMSYSENLLTSRELLLRCVFPRLRMDQMIKLGWKYMTPLALLNLYIVIVMKMLGVA